MRFRIILTILFLILSACVFSHAENAPVECRIVPGAGGDYAVITGGAAAEDLVIPAKIDGVPVREIDRGAFEGISANIFRSDWSSAHSG